MAAFNSSGPMPHASIFAEAASPISSRPPAPAPVPAPAPQQQHQRHSSFEELAAAAAGGGVSFGDDGMLAGGGGGGSGASGNRWPREETIALIRIRSEMDGAFHDATLKAPLWEEVSRKLAELGYKRSAKKCKEKFENVHKYYKRTKEGRAGRQDGKSYRYFTELEALHTVAAASPTPTPPPAPPTPAVTANPNTTAFSVFTTMPMPPIQPTPISSAAPMPQQAPIPEFGTPHMMQGISFSSMSMSDSEDDSDEEVENEEVSAEPTAARLGKRKRSGTVSKTKQKMMNFFEGLMKQVMERQEAMQKRFMETMEKREQERSMREEAWRRQEVARLTREQEMIMQERAAAAARDAAVVAFLQRISGGQLPPGVVLSPAANASASASPSPSATFSMPLPVSTVQTPPKQPISPTPSKQPPPPRQPPPPQQAQPLQQHPPPPPQQETRQHNSATSYEIVPVPEQHDIVGSRGGFEGTPSSRWPKAEVHTLIELRTELEARYQEAGPKGPLWEDISAAMKRRGYDRSSKRCKEKWENINKYFKKVKESSKKRPEDSKTCPYFHQLDALYRRKLLVGGGVGGGTTGGEQQRQVQDAMTNAQEIGGKSSNDTDRSDHHNNSKMNAGNGEGTSQIPTSNGEMQPCLLESSNVKKPEGTVRELSEQEQPHGQFPMDDMDSDDMTQDDYNDEDDGEEGEEANKMQYRIQYQRPNVSSAPTMATSAAATATATPQSTYIAMVQ